ncbi:HesA/MoeB/ThiF family protein [Kangiella marina]|uniref:Molybdopterin-synthase adenylyltransferase MoeB n=1 Tax=Kangiella marina TaxID=1079178 RepID=A0ABP8IAX2_9GAMM
MLTQSELLQYSRHIILPEIDLAGQESIKSSHILIIGMGGLGSPAALYLAAAGVGSLTIIDHDTVETSNLQRQVIHDLENISQSKVTSAEQSLSKLSAHLKVHSIQQKASLELLNSLSDKHRFTAVLDCSDNFETRFMLNQWSIDSGIPLISASAVGFTGQLAVFNQSTENACYQCLYSQTDLPEGDCEDQGILSPVVGTMGTLQATEALKLILGLGTMKKSYLLKYDALATEFKRFSITKDPECPICS